MIKKIIIFQIALVLVLSSCGKDKRYYSEYDTLTVGTFNAEWLGDGINDKIERSEQDYKNIANIIINTGSDIMGLEEVENATAIYRILRYMPGWDFIIGDCSGKQNCAVVYKKGLQIKKICDYYALEIEPQKTRPGLMLEAKKGNFDCYLLVVHYKATSHYDDTQEKRDESYDIRKMQAARTSRWVDSLLAINKEQDLIMLGDFNDSPKRKKNNTLTDMINNPAITFLTGNLKSCKYKTMYGIDQIAVSSSARKRYIERSERTYDFTRLFSKAEVQRISDHNPVMVKFEVKTKDND